MTSAKYGEVAHILSQLPLGVSTQPDTEIPQLFPYCGEPHTWGNIECAVSGTAGEENEWLKELQALAAPIWAAALPLSGGLALYHSFQPHPIGQWNSHEKLSLLPSILPLLQPPWVRWCGGMLLTGSRSALPGQCGGWLLAPCATPLESQLGRHCLALLSLEGRKPQNSLYAPALPKENMFFLLIVFHAEKTPKSPLQKKPLEVPDLG